MLNNSQIIKSVTEKIISKNKAIIIAERKVKTV